VPLVAPLVALLWVLLVVGLGALLSEQHLTLLALALSLLAAKAFAWFDLRYFPYWGWPALWVGAVGAVRGVELVELVDGKLVGVVVIVSWQLLNNNEQSVSPLLCGYDVFWVVLLALPGDIELPGDTDALGAA